MGRYEIRKAVWFEAAHHFPSAPDARHRAMHGHSFRVEVALSGTPGADGRIEDLKAISDRLTALARALDHRLLNEIEGLATPTLENLCAWIARQLRADYGARLRSVIVARPSLGETCLLELD